MLANSDTNIEDVASIILGHNYDVAFLVPTETGLKKSILDAHQSIKALFQREQFHDYENQRQGDIYKATAHYITSNEIFDKTVSLYRPNTKKGDPRIWISGLNRLAKAGNLIALVIANQDLYIINCSDKKSLNYALETGLPKVKLDTSEVANELLNKLIKVSHKGFIRTIKAGDTGIGMTIESELGIIANASKKPDYKGIELKSTRVGQKLSQKNRSTLFSCVPEWSLSPSAPKENLLQKRGYFDSDGLLALRHTISGLKPNSLGLFFDLDYVNGYLRQMFKDVNLNDFNAEHDTTWLISELKKRLLDKHKETFWIKAVCQGDGINEEFHYVEAEHTMNPYISKFETLIETGIITMDYTMHIKESGKWRDHGFLFKLKPNQLPALFPEAIKHDLRY
ncbi:MvaI/BcnI family restriction endonuclease [Candidatus Thioglobus sp. NP1]|uniref:MvaI/BcnI family restriction endonuclease n=1 Tax=Candidatus Thioglobus sp. NP1 TaxID=2508687 RepID=UPI000DED480C|nr:MvaI/BcnI family restriction endonuclease [Candidatus Thioglobus sp. NP1]AXE62016.1 hypothetical protein CRN91_04970 [Candidatus Thioglobus sp. NP1]